MAKISQYGSTAPVAGDKVIIARPPRNYNVDMTAFMMIPYVITPSVAGNNLTVALKHMDGSDPSSDKPMKFRVGNTDYSLTAAMSFVKNAGTNWANAGSANLAGNAIDWFMYAIGETGASAGLKFGYGRIPYARTMGDFVNTTTSEKYILGNWTNFNSTDPVILIGRFRAQLSAAAAYNWSIASALVVNYPITWTDWLTFTPAPVGFLGTPTNTIYEYKLIDRDMIVRLRENTAGTSNSTSYSYTAPFTAKTVTNGLWASYFLGKDNGSFLSTPSYATISQAASTIVCFLTGASAAASWTAANGKQCFFMELRYTIG